MCDKGYASEESNRLNPESSPKNKVRYAVVGLGYIAQVAVLPAFAHAKENSELVALVSGDAISSASSQPCFRLMARIPSLMRRRASPGPRTSRMRYCLPLNSW